jgi:hypothetical protein
MEQDRKEIRRALLVCIPYLVIIFFLDNIDKLLYSIHSRLGNPLLVLYMFIATVIIIALLIHAAMDIREHYRVSGYIAVIPLLIYIVAIINSFWSPVRISSEMFQSRIVHRAFRREHLGHAQMKMRENGNLDIRYPGPFGISDWEYGHWSRAGDIFYLHYDRGIDTIPAKPDTLTLAPDGLLIPIGIPADTLSIYKDRFFRMVLSRKK